MGTDYLEIKVNDISRPTANAGPDQIVENGSIVTFNGSQSFDNVGISNYSWAFTFDGSPISLFNSNPIFNFTIPGNYSVTLIVYDLAGNSATDTMTVTVNPPLDSDGAGIPDSLDIFPYDNTEWQDSDSDGIGNNADNDDDGDGYLDTWEQFLGTDPLDPTKIPSDIDGDGIPDGDAANSQPWMDTDDDNDGVPDAEEGELAEPSFIEGHWWLILLIPLIVVLCLMVALRRKPEPVERLTEPNEIKI